MKKIIRLIKGFWYRRYYVMLDGRANSVTISKAIYKHIMRYERANTDILVFKSNDTGLYCFCMREDFPLLMQANSVFSSLQYNEEHLKIGFRSDNPSVTAILDSYSCPLDKMVSLTVLPRKTVKGECFYEIQRPQK